jgi:hypothetical protein
MDASRFDALTRRFGKGPSRRGVLAGMLAALARVSLTPESGVARKKNQKIRKVCHCPDKRVTTCRTLKKDKNKVKKHLKKHQCDYRGRCKGFNPCADCVTNAQCGGGQVCIDGICQDCTLTSQCSGGQVCLGAPARCVGGEACAGEAECAAINPLLRECVNGACQLLTQCTVNGDCGAGESCLLGECATTCSSDSDCVLPEQCFAGVCLSTAMISDRAVKANIASVDPVDMLTRVRDLPIATWNYTSDDPAIRHIGPMAQDFAATFGVGVDDRHIHPVDAHGVALAAIQGLAAELERVREENAALAARLAALEQMPATE